MKKIVINKCYGGFGVSAAAILRLRELGLQSAIDSVLKGEMYPAWIVDGVEREPAKINEYDFSHSLDKKDRGSWQLIKVVEEMGKMANGEFSELKIVEVPDHIEWEIEEYDGMEWVSEKHETWG